MYRFPSILHPSSVAKRALNSVDISGQRERLLGDECGIFTKKMGRMCSKTKLACFERASPALKEVLLRIYQERKPLDVDYHFYEFGSMEYHIQSSASEPHHAYLSISTPLLSLGVLLSHRLSKYTMQIMEGVPSDVLEIVEPAKEGYQLTLKINLDKIPHGKDSSKVIAEISSVQAVILSSQLKEMLKNVDSQEISEGMFKPIKLVYHPREPFYIIRQPQRITAVFPMRFKEYIDVLIATAFFQELVDAAGSNELAKAPPCNWSPIPPPELIGEPMEELTTNGGFVSFDIHYRHVEGKNLDKTVWNLLNFYTYVKHHVKCTRAFIQRRMRKRLKSLVESLQETSTEENMQVKKSRANVSVGCKCTGKVVRQPKFRNFKVRYGAFTRKIKRVRSTLKIHGFGRVPRQWFSIPTLSTTKYTKLDRVDI